MVAPHLSRRHEALVPNHRAFSRRHPHHASFALLDVEADSETSAAIRGLIELTYQAMSNRGGDVAELFGDDDVAVAGSGQGELFYG